MMIDELDLCVRTGDFPNDFEVETIIGKRFDGNNKVEWLVKWMACGLCEATYECHSTIPTVHMWYLCEAQWNGEQQAPHPKHQSKVMATLDGTKVTHTHNVLMVGANE